MRICSGPKDLLSCKKLITLKKKFFFFFCLLILLIHSTPNGLVLHSLFHCSHRTNAPGFILNWLWSNISNKHDQKAICNPFFPDLKYAFISGSSLKKIVEEQIKLGPLHSKSNKVRAKPNDFRPQKSFLGYDASLALNK